MQAHVTCGRGTEVFVKDELLDKLKCQVMGVEDGKVFFAVSEPDPASNKHNENMFYLKTAERIFVTVTHFPTCEIKGNGKVQFLHALKDRILNCSSLSKAVKDAQRLQMVQRMLQQRIHSKCGQAKDIEHSFESYWNTPSQLSECPSGLDGHIHSSTSKILNRKDLHCDQQSDSQVKPLTPPVIKPSEHNQTADNYPQENKCGELRKPSCCGGQSAHSQVQGVTVKEEPQGCFPSSPPEKRRKLDKKHVSGNFADSRGKFGIKDSTKVPVKQPMESSSGIQRGGYDSAMSFRFSVKCGGWCKKWLKPQRLAKELGIRVAITKGWMVDLHTPDIEFCVHINDDFVTAGIPLTRVPLSKRDYILDAGLRSTVSWIMASQAQIQPGHRVLDPMCGKATILVEAAREYSEGADFMGCDLDEHQLQAAARNVKSAQLSHRMQLIQADALNMPLTSASVDRIVCDAPFGQKFAVASHSLPQFYKRLMQEMYRLLVPGGIAVLLTSQDLLPVVEEIVQTVSHSASHAPHTPSSRPQTQLCSAVGGMETDFSGNLSEDPCHLVSSGNLMSPTKTCLAVGEQSEATDQTRSAKTEHPVKDSLDRSSPEVTASASGIPLTEVVPLVLETEETRLCSQVTTHTPSTSSVSLEMKTIQKSESDSKNSLANSSTQVPASVWTSTHINIVSKSGTVQNKHGDPAQSMMTSSVTNSSTVQIKSSDPQQSVPTSSPTNSPADEDKDDEPPHSVQIRSVSSSNTVQKESGDSPESSQTSNVTSRVTSYSGGLISGSRKSETSHPTLFSLLSSHYVKMGETHAYIVVLQKAVQEQDVKL